MPEIFFQGVSKSYGKEKIQAVPTQQKAYAAQVSRLDADIGRILALLKELGLDASTLVMVSGDNGSSFNENSELGRRFDQSMGGHHPELVTQAQSLMKAAHRDDPNWPIFANPAQRNTWRKKR